ncbi:hypothetical protein ACH5RR_019819 [Cinchona calisaya]|uniref:Cystatin domain-containing protein n=1 Tax=Cinchona calisaya TaxID=153742 RepID=A0ABD2ZU17_9GENT
MNVYQSSIAKLLIAICFSRAKTPEQRAAVDLNILKSMLGHKPEEQFYIKKMEKSSLASLKHQKLEKKQYTSINRPEQDTVMRRLRHKSSPWGPPMDVEPREFMKGGDYTHCSSYTVKHDPGVWERYYQQIQESKGFEIDDFPGQCMAAGIVPLKNLDESSEFYFLLSQMATKALNEFNSDKEKSYIFHKIVRVNSEVSGGVIYYTTFEALNPEAAYAIQIFRAKIFDHGPRGTDVLSCKFVIKRFLNLITLRGII